MNSTTGETLDECSLFYTIFQGIFYINPCFDIYQVGQLCPLLWDTLGFPYSDFYLPVGFDEVYFNRTEVKQQLHVPLNSDWEICSSEPVFVNDTDLSPPSGKSDPPPLSTLNAEAD